MNSYTSYRGTERTTTRLLVPVDVSVLRQESEDGSFFIVGAGHPLAFLRNEFELTESGARALLELLSSALAAVPGQVEELPLEDVA